MNYLDKFLTVSCLLCLKSGTPIFNIFFLKSHDPYAGQDEEKSPSAEGVLADQEKARTVLAAARQQGLAEKSNNRDDFARKLYLGLRDKKKKLRKDEDELSPEEIAQLEQERLQKELALQDDDSSSEDEFIEQEKTERIDDKRKDERKKKKKHRSSSKHESKKKRKHKSKKKSDKKYKKKRRKRSDDSDTSSSESDSSSDDSSSDESDRDRKKRHRHRKKKSRSKKYNNDEDDTDSPSKGNDMDSKDNDDRHPHEKNQSMDYSASKVSRDSDSDVDFIPTKRYIGSKIGFIFKMDRKGLGYYVDSLQQKSNDNVNSRKRIGPERPSS